MRLVNKTVASVVIFHFISSTWLPSCRQPGSRSTEDDAGVSHGSVTAQRPQPGDNN